MCIIIRFVYINKEKIFVYINKETSINMIVFLLFLLFFV